MYHYFSRPLQLILHAKETTSPAPVAAVSTKSGYVMERMTVRTMLMRKAVVRIQKLEKHAVIDIDFFFCWEQKC